MLSHGLVILSVDNAAVNFSELMTEASEALSVLMTHIAAYQQESLHLNPAALTENTCFSHQTLFPKHSSSHCTR